MSIENSRKELTSDQEITVEEAVIRGKALYGQFGEELQNLQKAGVHPGAICGLGERLAAVFAAVGRFWLNIAETQNLNLTPQECQVPCQAFAVLAADRLTTVSAGWDYASHITRLEKTLQKQSLPKRSPRRQKLTESLHEVRLLQSVWQGALRFAWSEIELYQAQGEQPHTSRIV